MDWLFSLTRPSTEAITFAFLGWPPRSVTTFLKLASSSKVTPQVMRYSGSKKLDTVARATSSLNSMIFLK